MKLEFVKDDATNERFVKADDVARRIEFDFPAIYTFYRVVGVNPTIEPIGPDPIRIIALLWVGLLLHQPELEMSEVKRWFTPQTARAFYTGTMEAFNGDMPGSESEEAAEPDPPRA
jgi:hypothetical protein